MSLRAKVLFMDSSCSISRCPLRCPVAFLHLRHFEHCAHKARTGQPTLRVFLQHVYYEPMTNLIITLQYGQWEGLCKGHGLILPGDEPVCPAPHCENQSYCIVTFAMSHFPGSHPLVQVI